MNTLAPEEMTGAEQRAHGYAESLKAAGWRVTINVVEYEPKRYSDGRIMISGFRSVGLSAQREWYESTLHGIWHSVTEPSDGHRRTTCYREGALWQHVGGKRKIRHERDFGCWVSTLETVTRAGGSIEIKHERGDSAP